MKQNNMVKAKVSVRGTRPLLQHAFGPESIPLESQERAGVAGNDPGEWKKTCLVTDEGQLYILGTYVFGCLRNGAKHVKKGRGSLQPLVGATLQVLTPMILLNRWKPKEGDPPYDRTGGGSGAEVYIDVCGVKNPQTKARNIRYRLATAPGWECTFEIAWDKTVVSRDVMRLVLNRASTLAGLGDGISVGNGRFEVLSYEEVSDAEETAAVGNLEEPPKNRVAPRQKKMPKVPEVVETNGVPC